MSIPAVSDLSLREKVGQLFVIGFDGPTPTDHVASIIDDWGLGGVIYFSRNVSTPEATATLSADLQAEADSSGHPPLFVAIDQEGGTVSRLGWGTELPGAMAIGATRDDELARQSGDAVGEELRSLGVNFNLAPVLDVNNNPDNPVIGVRSFGEDPGLVGRLGSQVVTGLQSSDVLACGKHFPGHGDTDTDSHLDLPVIPHDRERLDAVELPPFKRAIEADVDAIMTTHVAFPALTGDEETPATISRPVITGLLRDDLGYAGLVITDCLEMDAIADGVGTAEAAVQAVEAGCDLLTVSHTPEVQEAALQAVYEAVRTGRLPESRLDRSVERILQAKRQRAIGDSPETAWEVAAERSHEVASAIASKAVTVVRDRSNMLPVDDVTLVAFPDPGAMTAEDDRYDPDDLAHAIRSASCSVERYDGPGAPRLDAGETAVVATVDASHNDRQVAVVESLVEGEGDVVVIALRNPYDLQCFPGIDCYLTTYDYTPASLSAVGAVLSGDLSPSGTLPVTIPDNDSPD